MAKPDVSVTDLFALGLAVESERSGITIKQIAQCGQCSNEVIAEAEETRAALVQMRRDLHEYAAEEGIPQDEADDVFNGILAGMVGRRGSVH